MDILTASILIFVIILILFFFLYKRIVAVAALFIFLLFITSIIFTISALFLPQLYKTGAEVLVKDTPFAQQLKYADGTFTEIGKLPSSIIGTIGNLFGQNNQTQEFKTDLYNQFVDFFGGLLRILVLVIALIIMLVSVYVRFSYSGLVESQKLEKKVKELEKEINLIKGISKPI